MAGIDGVAAAAVDAPADEPTLEVEVDLAAAQAHGIKAGRRPPGGRHAPVGPIVGSLFEDQKVFDVVVWGTPEIRTQPVERPGPADRHAAGGHVRLGDVADVRIASSPDVIKREGVLASRRRRDRVRGPDLDAVAGDVQAAIGRIPFPLEHHAELLGGYADAAAERDRMIALGVAAAIGVFLLLQAASAAGGWRLSLFLTLPPP